MPLSQADRLLTLTTPLGADAALLVGFSGREELSRPFSFALDLVTDQPIAPADLVGQPVAWQVVYPDDAPRKFHGLVRSLAVGPAVGRGLRSYRAEVVPWLWFLTRGQDCRIYQNLSVPDILAAVFGRYGFTAFRNDCTGTYTAREYCVQYRESAFAFVSRLMEEEGIFYKFEHADGAHTLVLCDAVSNYADCAPHASVEFRPELANAEVVGTWERRYEFVTGKAAHTDYHFITPATDLLATTDTVVALPDVAKFERFEFPGGYTATGAGTARVAVRMEEEEVGYDTARGTGRCSSFQPGCKFALSGHPLDDGNSFALLAVDHSASEPHIPGVRDGRGEYSNSFDCLPADRVFRPARTTPKPMAVGPQWAVVVGPAGEEIYTDQYGRVKVQFVWDRVGTKDENSSCWVRLTESWAGKNWGTVFLPRIGQEVIVEFLNGDPDRPLVTGRVYNAAFMPPYTLPDNKTQSGLKTRSSKEGGTEDFNELRFEDKKGSEDIYFHAQKDFHRHVENDDDLQVLHDQTITVTNARTLTVKDADETITIEKGNRSRTVSKGNDTLTVGEGNRAVTVSKGTETLTVSEGDRTVTVDQGKDTHNVNTGDRVVLVKTGNDTHTVSTGNREVTVETGNDTLTVTTGNHTVKVSAGASSLEAAQSITLKCGPSEIKIAPDGITIKGPTIKIAGDTMAEIKSVKTDVKGDGMLTLKGGITMIN
jgi:type VI secretion system secreted protein VgrG